MCERGSPSPHGGVPGAAGGWCGSCGRRVGGTSARWRSSDGIAGVRRRGSFTLVGKLSGLSPGEVGPVGPPGSRSGRAGPLMKAAARRALGCRRGAGAVRGRVPHARGRAVPLPGAPRRKWSGRWGASFSAQSSAISAAVPASGRGRNPNSSRIADRESSAIDSSNGFPLLDQNVLVSSEFRPPRCRKPFDRAPTSDLRPEGETCGLSSPTGPIAVPASCRRAVRRGTSPPDPVLDS